MLRLFIPDFEDTNKKQMKLFRCKEIFDQAVAEIIKGGGLVAL